MGPYAGPTGAVVALPLIVLAFAWFCRGDGWTQLPQRLPTLAEVGSLWSWQAMGVYVAWFAFQAALHVLVPGRDVPGTKLRNGRTLTYRINGARASATGGAGGGRRGWVGGGGGGVVVRCVNLCARVCSQGGAAW
jgi:hypothetical protein